MKTIGSSAILFLTTAWSMGAATPAVTVTAAPTSVAFVFQAGAAKLPSSQTVSVKASTGTPGYTASITGPNSLWLTVSPDSGKLPSALSLQANPTSLPVGSYSATVSLAVDGVASPLTIPVTLAVTAAPSTLNVTPASLTFVAPPMPTPAQTLQLSTNGGPIAFTVASGSPWMTVTPAVGVVLPGAQLVLTVSIDASSLLPQAQPYTGKITITQTGTGSTAKTQNVTVNLTVNSATPVITGIWPSTLPLNSGAQTVTIRGLNFYKGTTARLQGVVTALAITILGPDAMLAVIPATNLTTASTLYLIASNPAPGGDSAPAPLPAGNIPSIQAVGNVASYGTVSASPGELVTIFGSNIGPTIAATMSITNGFVDTTLGGVTATIDNQPAPLLYVSQNQITLQIPYEVTQGAGKQLVITNGAAQPANSTLTITPTAPGLFTADGSGAGQAAALNFSAATGAYTLNAGTNPAKVGDTILLYLTGEGDYNPTIVPRTGLIVPALNPLPQLNPLPTVTIGGAAATVSYAGPLVGSILGLLQLNVVVPPTATTGQAVPVVVNIAGSGTQAGVTLSIHP